MGKWLLIAAVTASFIPWAWRFSPWADRTADGLFDDPTFGQIAEPICAATYETFDALPNALTAANNVERAGIVSDANALLAAMVDDLQDEVTGSERDIANINEWLSNWRTYLDNRADFAERFASDENAVFYVDAVGRERLDRRIPRFADANHMPSCGTPSDVG